MMSKRILILTAGEGHLSIARAIATVLKKAGFQVKINPLLSTKHFRVYLAFYRYFPSLHKIPFQLGEKQTIQKAAKVVLEKSLLEKIKNEVKMNQPDLIISAYFFYYPAVVKLIDYQKKPLPFINILTDPWSIAQGAFCNNADLNLVYDHRGVKLGRKMKTPKETLISTGWFIRHQFYQNYNLTTIRKKLGFKKNILTLLICGGSEGTNLILKIIPALLTAKKPLQAIVVCGTNKTLYKALHSFKKLFPAILKNQKKQLNFKIFKFTDKMAQFMAVSDLVIGKAGPNLIFETVAAGKPFMAITHIAGQEDGNLDLIRKKRLGFVEENPIKAIRLLKKIINNPSLLDKFQSHIKKERQYNLQAGRKLVKLVKELI